MPIVAKQGSGTSFTPAPAGVHAAVCVDVVDLGEVKVSYNGKEKVQHKVRIVWQIEEDRDDGKPFQVSKRYTLSLHEKAAMRKDLESWRGRAFTEAELDGFDLENLLSVPCMINVVHVPNPKDAKNPYANVTAIMRLAKGMNTPQPRDYVRVCDREPDPQQGQATPPDMGISDDDIPF